MREIIVFLLLGVGSGALISGTGIGVVLSYRGSGLINLAAGSLAMLSGYCFWSLDTGYFGPKLATWAAVVVTLVFSTIVGVIFEALIIYPLRNATPLAKLVASLGFLIAAIAGVTLAFGGAGEDEPSFIPLERLHLFGYVLLGDRFIVAGIVLGIWLVVMLVYRYTRFGIGTRAASENEFNATLAGLSPRSLSLVNTLLMAWTMAAVGLCAGSIQVLDPNDLPLLVVPGLAAAMFGSLSSIGVTFVAGTIMGALQSLLLWLSTLSWFPNSGFGNPWPGFQELLTFVVLVIAVVARAGKVPSRGEIREIHLPRAYRPKRPLRSALGASAAAAICLWFFPGLYKITLITSLIWAMVLFSIVLVTGFVGQISALQLAIGVAAGYGTGEFTLRLGIGFPWAPILGVIAGSALGALLGIPALRVRGVSLVIVTLAGAVAFSDFIFANPNIGRAAFYLNVPHEFGFGVGFSEVTAYNGELPTFTWSGLVLACCALTGYLVVNVRRSHLGREMLAVRSNERAAAAVGIHVANTKLVAYALAAGVAGLAGVLLCYSYGPSGLGATDALTTLSLIAFAYIGGITTVPGALLGGLLLTGNLLSVCLQRWFSIAPEWTTLGAGLVLIAVLVGLPDGLAGFLFYRDRSLARRLGDAIRPARAPDPVREVPETLG